MNKEKIYISWQEFHQETKRLCHKLKKAGEFNKIVAVSRGGLIPAGIIAYELGIQNTHTINISTYDGEHRRDNSEVDITLEAEELDEKTFVVDDLADTGNTFDILRKHFPLAKYVSVYAKPAGEKSVDIFASSMPDQWIVFPWD